MTAPNSSLERTRRAQPPGFTLISAIALLAFALPTICSAETALQELERMEQMWRNSGVTTYTFRPHGQFNLMGDTPPVVVKVRDGHVSRITFEAPYRKYRTGQRISTRALEKIRPAPILTVEEFFAFLREFIDPEQPAGGVQYHPTLGYPLFVNFDNPEMDDEEMLVEILSLEVGR